MKPKFYYVAWDLGNGKDLWTVSFGTCHMKAQTADQLTKVIRRAYKEGLQDGQREEK